MVKCRDISALAGADVKAKIHTCIYKLAELDTRHGSGAPDRAFRIDQVEEIGHPIGPGIGLAADHGRD